MVLTSQSQDFEDLISSQCKASPHACDVVFASPVYFSRKLESSTDSEKLSTSFLPATLLSKTSSESKFMHLKDSIFESMSFF